MKIPPGFDALRAGFSGDIVMPGDEEYQAAIHRWAENASKPAAAVLFVKTDEDVRAALDFAKDSKVDFAVRGEFSPTDLIQLVPTACKTSTE